MQLADARRLKQNKTIRQVAEEMSGLDKAKLNELLAPSKQSKPGWRWRGRAFKAGCNRLG